MFFTTQTGVDMGSHVSQGSRADLSKIVLSRLCVFFQSLNLWILLQLTFQIIKCLDSGETNAGLAGRLLVSEKEYVHNGSLEDGASP